MKPTNRYVQKAGRYSISDSFGLGIWDTIIDWIITIDYVLPLRDFSWG